MEKPSEENFEPITVDEAVEMFINRGNNEAVIKFLRKNKDNKEDGNVVMDFCLRVFETYQPGDKTGIVMISQILEKLL
jgi:N-acetylglucosamine kinase-like BadF-type ATPase